MRAGESDTRSGTGRGTPSEEQSIQSVNHETGLAAEAEKSLLEQQERYNLRRLQAMMQLLLASIAQDKSMTVDDAAQMVAYTRDAALRMFPGRETAYAILCRPKIQRAMRERFHIQ